MADRQKDDGSQERLEALARLAPFGIFSSRPDGATEYVNARWCEITGLTPAAARGDGWLLSIHPDDRLRVERVWADAVAARAPCSAEYRFRRPDGAITWVMAQAVPDVAPAGELLGFVGTITDISDLRRAEAAWRREEERFRYVSLATRDAIYDWDIQAGSVQRNEVYRTIYGPLQDHLTDENGWEAAVHADDRPRVIESLAAAFRERRSEWTSEYRYRRADASWATVVDRGHIVYDAAGRALRMIGAISDFSERKEAEEALRRSQRSREALVESIDGVVWELDLATSRFVYVSRQAERILGHPLSDWFAEPSAWLQHLHPDDRDAALAHRLAGAGTLRSHEHEYRMLAADGRTLWMRDIVNVEVVDGRPVTLRGVLLDITEHRRAEHALRESEERYRTLVEAAAEAITVVDMETGRFDDVNASAVRIFGRSREELLRCGPVDVSPAVQPDGRPSSEVAREYIAQAMAGGTPAFEWTHLDGQGREVPVEVRVSRMPGERARVRGTLTDIRGRKRAEAQREGHLRVLELVAADAPLQGTLATLCAHIESQHEDALCSVLLLDEAGERLVHGAAPRLPEGWLRAVDGVRIGPRVGSCGTAAFENRRVVVTDITTDPLWADHHHLATPYGLRACWSTPIVSSGDQVLGTFAVYYRAPRGPAPEEERLVAGATHLAAIAIERARARVALRESEAKFRSLYTETPVMMHSIDREGRLVSVSNRWLEALGYAREEVIGRRSIEFLSPESRERAVNVILPEYFRTGVLQDAPYQFVRKDGGLVDVLLSAIGERDAQGNVVRSLAVLIDVTDRLKAEAARQRAEERELASMREKEVLLREQLAMEEQLRQAQRMEALGRLAGGVAHDFNNLLTAIMANSELLLHLAPPGGAQLEGLIEIKQAVERGAALTRQLLAFSRKQVLEPRVIDLTHVLRGMANMLRRLIGEDIGLEVRSDPGLGLVRADAGQIEQVLLNLVVNARDAIGELDAPGGRLRIETRDVVLDAGAARAHGLSGPGEYVALIVADTGCGMDPATLGRIFEPFFTTKSPAKGTGLGLSTVYGIVRQSGGSVVVESEVGLGSTFQVLLPRVHEETPARGVPTSPRRLATGVETILLVEDDGAVREGVRRILAASGYVLLVAGTGDEALAEAAAHSGRVDLLVTDTIMPGMTGSQLAARLRHVRPLVKVLHISGYPEEAIAQRGAAVHGAGFLAKPFTTEALLRRVRDVLDA